ncbi:LysR family transcriptional regulator [Rhodobacter xanthinilyticus]|uniref:LysR family transcriptional regulator n=1 Tax=Rhodobacter xanthinilyticus TaxID=1850250 RepID=A0A1D9MDN7_9RHOB|nr:hydrogen peroxide-inducible genes activator [Rhodobacter xanthinilyticus]AOZ69972.1 LysR family transcriptional regulator [Rhodobacter xanthinilyticus]
MIGLTMKHLRYFDALAREGHFGRAAEACSVTQPALSVQIRELEALVGAPLIERGPRGARLTALGEDFATRTRAILRSVDELDAVARAARTPLTGHLRLGVIPTVAPYLLPRLITGLGRTLPGLELRPREAITSKLIADLHEGRLDAALVALPISEPALIEAPILEEEFVLVRAQADADRPVPGPEGLREMRLLLLEEGHCFRDQALSFCKLPARGAREIMEGSSLATLVQMVGAGFGVTLIPEMAVAVEARSAPVALTRLPAPRPSRRLGLVWRKTNPLAEDLARLAQVMRRIIRPEAGAPAE